MIWYGKPTFVAHQSVIDVCLVQAFPALTAEHVALCALFFRCFSLGIMSVRVSNRDESLQTPLQYSELLLESETIF